MKRFIWSLSITLWILCEVANSQLPWQGKPGGEGGKGGVGGNAPGSDTEGQNVNSVTLESNMMDTSAITINGKPVDAQSADTQTIQIASTRTDRTGTYVNGVFQPGSGPGPVPTTGNALLDYLLASCYGGYGNGGGSVVSGPVNVVTANGPDGSAGAAGGAGADEPISMDPTHSETQVPLTQKPTTATTTVKPTTPNPPTIKPTTVPQICEGWWGNKKCRPAGKTVPTTVPTVTKKEKIQKPKLVYTPKKKVQWWSKS